MEAVKANLIVINEEYCPRNHRCSMVNLCEKNAISQEDQNSYPIIDMNLCDDCGDCYSMCRAFEKKY
jgi:MinD superfamily P-loop ATPase